MTDVPGRTPGRGGVRHFLDGLADLAREAPDAVALRWFGGRDGARVREEVTFADLAGRVERTAAGLRALGMEPGDRVLFSIRPRPEGVILCLAVLRAGGAVVFVDPGSTPELFAARIAAARPRWAATEALLYAASSGALRGIARSRGLLLPDYGRLPVRHLYTGRWLPGVPRGARRVARLGRTTPPGPTAPAGAEAAGAEATGTETAGTETAGTETAGTETAGTETAGAAVTGTETAGTETTGAAVAGAETAEACGPGARAGSADGDLDAVALVVFTSGTTSDPKAVVHTARTLGGMLDLFAQVGDLRPGQRAHTDQMFLGLPAVLAGGTWEIPARSPRDAPGAFARGVAGADSSFLVPADVTALLDVLEARDGGAGAVGAGGAVVGPAVLAVGAAPVTVALLERGRRVLPGTRWLAVYGATEILPAAVTDADEKIAAAASGDLVGRPLAGIDVRIDPTAADSPDDPSAGSADDLRDPASPRSRAAQSEETPVSKGRSGKGGRPVLGELVLSGPSLMAGYLSDVDGGRPPVTEHRTGDLAYQDADGRIVLVGRNRDMIIRGTVNIYPGLFEPRLRDLPGVADAVLVGVPRPDGDERVVLVVTADGGSAPADAPGRADGQIRADGRRRPDGPGRADQSPVRVDTALTRAVTEQVARVLDHGALPDLVVEATHLPLAGRSRKPDRRTLVNWVSPLTGTVRA